LGLFQAPCSSCESAWLAGRPAEPFVIFVFFVAW
jgi:hypothetical protein